MLVSYEPFNLFSKPVTELILRPILNSANFESLLECSKYLATWKQQTDLKYCGVEFSLTFWRRNYFFKF